MGTYASKTKVSPERSKAEIETQLRRYGANQVVTGWSDNGAVLIAFALRGRAVRFTHELPQAKDFLTPKQHEQAVWQRWRAIVLWFRAQLEWIELGQRDVEEVFMPWLVLPGGRTFGEDAIPKLTAAIEGGKLPKLLPNFTLDG